MPLMATADRVEIMSGSSKHCLMILLRLVKSVVGALVGVPRCELRLMLLLLLPGMLMWGVPSSLNVRRLGRKLGGWAVGRCDSADRHHSSTVFIIIVSLRPVLRVRIGLLVCLESTGLTRVSIFWRGVRLDTFPSVCSFALPAKAPDKAGNKDEANDGPHHNKTNTH